MYRKIREEAIFVSDVHYQKGLREKFLDFLEKIESHEIIPSQIFFMGDIFDLLVGGIKESIVENIDVIDRLEKISKKYECYYFEGNHDFNLKDIFPYMEVFPRESQPQIFMAKDEKIALSHGDLWLNNEYEVYIKTIKEENVIKVLEFLNKITKNYLYKKIQEYNASKNLCKEIENFSQTIKNKIKKYKEYDVKIVLEGHFHQNVMEVVDEVLYINLPSLECNGEIFEYAEERFYLRKII
ncbi:UDP-2,3-diacylglucosamine diphosphatase [Nitrosophilus kaiyonis]|uniref:UDP-2,3-diacylglucosamine diphosphatase n=1 Tax=Nitrosophilus kaiyonis TaxID=2930200 RepID=UPI00249198C8|nr:metallophosphoesterase [Nitrosophilus kaiyonis]